MSFLNSDELLNLLQRQLLLTGQQRQKITLEKGKQRQKLLKRADDNGMEADKSYPDLVDIVASFQLEIHGRSEVATACPPPLPCRQPPAAVSSPDRCAC